MIDTDGADELKAIIEELDEQGVGFAVARLNAQGKARLRLVGIDPARFYLSVAAAVAALQEAGRAATSD